MITPLFALITANGACTAALGTTPTRFYPFGTAPQAVAYPYATWQLISATPDNLLSGAPPVEVHRVQIDVWAAASNPTSADTTAAVIRDCLEATGHMLTFATGSDPQTKSYRVSMDFDLWISR